VTLNNTHKLVLAAVLMAAMAGLYMWQQSRLDTVKADNAKFDAANEAMIALNRSDAELPERYTASIAKLTTAATLEPTRVADHIRTETLPLIDEAIALIDRAVTAADAYLATKSDTRMKAGVGVIRLRLDAWRATRERFVALEAKARGGATGDEILGGLAAIGLMMSIDDSKRQTAADDLKAAPN
jgi:hypothetical protein